MPNRNANDPKYIDVTRSIAERIGQLFADTGRLYERGGKGPQSYFGHQYYLNQQKEALRSALEEFNKKCRVDDLNPGQRKILDDARIDVDTPTPERPNERIQDIIGKGFVYFVQQGAREIYNLLQATGEFTLKAIVAIIAGIAAVTFGIPNFQSKADIEQLERSNDLADSSNVNNEKDQSRSSPTKANKTPLDNIAALKKAINGLMDSKNLSPSDKKELGIQLAEVEKMEKMELHSSLASNQKHSEREYQR